MKATATRDSGYRHVVRVRSHDLSIDEPTETGGTDAGPVQELRREPRFVYGRDDGDVRDAQGLGHRRRRGRLRVHAAERGCPTRFGIVVRLPDSSPTSRSSACASSPPSAGAPHARRRGRRRACRARHARALSSRGAALVLLDAGEAASLDVHGRIDAAVLVPLYVSGASCTPSSTRRREDLRRHPARSRSRAGARTTTRPTCG